MTSIAIVVPSYDDFECVVELARELHGLARKACIVELDLIVVNDSPWVDISEDLSSLCGDGHLVTIKVLQMKANLGHQAAIAVGLAWLLPGINRYSYVVTMDADGEDDPKDILQMISKLDVNAFGASLACVAKRGLRRENRTFRLGYGIYKLLTYLLLGASIDFGNYICFRPAAVEIVTRMAETSTHIAAATLRSRIPLSKVLSDRRRRYSGESRMGGYSSLVLHAFRAYSVFGDRIAVRLMMFVLVGLGATLIGILISGLIRFSGIIEVFPGWASIASLILIALGIAVAVNLFGLALLLISSARSSIGTTPLILLNQFLEKEIVLGVEKKP